MADSGTGWRAAAVWIAAAAFNFAGWGCLGMAASSDSSAAAPTPAAKPAVATAAVTPDPVKPAAAPVRWRGFNLQEKFNLESGNKPFAEEDFRLIAKLGFNFVRLPMDYRCWIMDGDWRKLDEARLREVDQAVALGKKYGIHVCLNFHRAPGFCVNRNPPERLSLWTDAEAQEVCALHWAAFARRYKGIPNTELSFNLVNEPSGPDRETYERVALLLIDAIRREDPDRLIVADGFEWGTQPCPGLIASGVMQSARGYAPATVSHYRADWAGNWDGLPPPMWPMPVWNGFLFGPVKPRLHQTLTVNGPFPRETELRLRVAKVSDWAVLRIEAGQVLLKEEIFRPGTKDGHAWKQAEWFPQWNCYQGECSVSVRAVIPAGTRDVTATLTAGDWLYLDEIGLRPTGAPAAETVLGYPTEGWRSPATVLACEFGPDGRPRRLDTGRQLDREWLRHTGVAPWLELEGKGVRIMVGEFGAFKYTPHDVVLRWMRDNLDNWQAAGWGWALWSFRGSFGILDSEREDVKYEPFEGHQLDRQMLELLQQH